MTYRPTASDAWAQDITRLADDEVTLDPIELLLIALQRAGHLSRPEALRLQVDYLREALSSQTPMMTGVTVRSDSTLSSWWA